MDSAKSLPPFPEDTFSSSGIFSAATHPSIQTRNKDDLLNRIRSGNDVLRRLPTRLDPNITFSDDDEEEDIASAPRALERPQRLHTLPSAPFRENVTPRPAAGSGSRQPYHSASKVCGGPLRERRPMPRSEMKPRNPAKACLMEQHEFKMPPLPGGVGPRDRIVVRGKPYAVLSQLGSGGSCKVFSAIDPHNALVALKCVDLKGTDPLIREGYKKEISYLQQLQGSDRVIKMYDYEYRENELFLVLERGEIDFARYISKEAKSKRRLTPLTLKFYWAQMLEAVSDIHALGIVHSDLKPANFLLVAGSLKLIDFGIATSVPDNHTSTFRDTQVGTLNYMSPEAVTALSQAGSSQVQFRVGVKSDVWSLGCILYNLAYGATPFQAARTLMQKIVAITSPDHPICFPPHPDPLLVDVLRRCLERDVKKRASVQELLQHPYLREAPPPPAPPCKSDQLTQVMEQMQVLTPRRMSLLTQMVKQLSEEKKEEQT